MKFKTIDQQYLDKREKLSQKYGHRELWSVIDHWPLYCGIGNLSRYLAIADLLRDNLDVPGHIAEFGSWRGANLLFMAKILRTFDPHGSKMIHAFDSFQGLTEFTPEDAHANKLTGDYKGSLEELLDFINLYEMSDEISIHKGLIEETLPQLLDARKELTFSFVYCDTDLYSSTADILRHMHPRLSKGGVFVFDEWNYENFPGEGVAVNEFLSKHGDSYEVRHIKYARQPNLVIQKVRI